MSVVNRADLPDNLLDEDGSYLITSHVVRHGDALHHRPAKTARPVESNWGHEVADVQVRFHRAQKWEDYGVIPLRLRSNHGKIRHLAGISGAAGGLAAASGDAEQDDCAPPQTYLRACLTMKFQSPGSTLDGNGEGGNLCLHLQGSQSSRRRTHLIPSLQPTHPRQSVLGDDFVDLGVRFLLECTSVLCLTRHAVMHTWLDLPREGTCRSTDAPHDNVRGQCRATDRCGRHVFSLGTSDRG